MQDIQFDHPVVLYRDGAILTVREPSAASAMLVSSWPKTRGKWYHAANRACLRAVKGLTPPHVARTVFQKAVEESMMNVR